MPGGRLSQYRRNIVHAKRVGYQRPYPYRFPIGSRPKKFDMAKRSRPSGYKARRSMAAYKPYRSRKAKFYSKNWVPSGLMGVEKKFFDATKAATLITATTDMASLEFDPATLNCLNAPTQGTGASNRDGDFYRISQVQVSGIITCAVQGDQVTADLAPVVRIYLVQDKFTNGNQLNSEDVFTNPSGLTAQCCNPLRVIKNEQRFKILDSTSIQIVPPTMSFDGTNVEQSGQTASWYLSYKWPRGLKVLCIANGGTIADIRDNSLHIIACCNSSNSAPNISYNSRIRFRG